MEQELLSTVEHQSSPHHQDGAVHFALGLVRRCQYIGNKYITFKTEKEIGSIVLWLGNLAIITNCMYYSMY